VGDGIERNARDENNPYTGKRRSGGFCGNPSHRHDDLKRSPCPQASGLHPVPTVPLAGDQILKDGESGSGSKLQQVVGPGDRFLPPLLVYPPDVDDLFYL
jgi:hypothetical protein